MTRRACLMCAVSTKHIHGVLKKTGSILEFEFNTSDIDGVVTE